MDKNRSTIDAEKLRHNFQDLPEPVVNPALIIVSGLPGTGKSFFSRQLAHKLPSVLLESDTLRKTLFSSPDYSYSESYRLFSACHYLIDELLRKGMTVILDATNLIEHNRETLYHIAEKNQAKLIIVQVKAPPEIVQQRLNERSKHGKALDNSDADWRVYQTMKPKTQRIRRNYFSLDSSKDIRPVIDKIVREAKK